MVSRKDFLKLSLAGGLGAVFGGARAVPESWHDRGARLVSVQRKSLLMGSVVSFQVTAASEQAGYQAIRKGVEAFRNADTVFSMYRPDSEMGRLGGNAGIEFTPLSGEALTVLEFSKKIYRMSGGIFDVTIEPAMRRWGFRKGTGEMVQRPDTPELKELQRLIGFEKLTIGSEGAYLEEKGMAVDTGGIAGGYALDRAVEVMRKEDISSAFINFSGDIHTFGEPLHGQKWPVYIVDPGTGRIMDQPVELSDEALSTSGSYRNRRSDPNGKSWGHLLNALSGRPSEPEKSVTAIHPSAMAADAWSTAAYLGAKPGDDRLRIIKG